MADHLAALLLLLGVLGVALGRHDPTLLTLSLVAVAVAVFHAHEESRDE